jgi:hypothetical protein
MYLVRHSSPAVSIAVLLMMASLGGQWLAAQDGVAPQTPLLGGEWGAPPATPDQEQPQVLSRGPVNEAFAAPVDMQLQQGVVAPVQPPPSINEVPPAERPQGQQFAWIPGYWSWDAERVGYIWVSACWRAAPPRMAWVPGYWCQVPGGWRWVSGLWSPAGVREIEYLPAPPAYDVVESRAPAPAPDMIWVPACMYWTQGQYVMRAGYWLVAQPNWVWVPSHYVWTPRGYIFAGGHWDYALERRGVFFAPVYFPASVYSQPAYTYSPSIVIDVGLLRVSLFVYPRYGHYYFGDYYDDAYLQVGIYPWFDSQRVHTWYDPIYEHDRWDHQRSDPHWEQQTRDQYHRAHEDKSLRPPRTYHEQEVRLAKAPAPQRQAMQVAQPMAVAATRRDTPLKFERTNADARQKTAQQATAVRAFRDDRNRWESTASRAPTVQPPRERQAPVVTPPVERREVAQPPEERRDPVQPPKERRAPVTPPVERRESIQPPRGNQAPVAQPTERRGPPTTVQREPVPAPPGEVRVTRPERLAIPVSPVVGGSGAPGFFRKGPPGRPEDEEKDKDGKDIRKNWGSR